MTMADALRQMDELPYHWTIGKGRVRQTEPLWAVQCYRTTESGLLDEDDPGHVIEGDSLEYCVTRMVAWHQQQSA